MNKKDLILKHHLEMLKKVYNYLFKACLHKWVIYKEGLILHKYGPKYGELAESGLLH